MVLSWVLLGIVALVAIIAFKLVTGIIRFVVIGIAILILVLIFVFNDPEPAAVTDTTAATTTTVP